MHLTNASNPITPTYGTINVFRIDTDAGSGELVLRVEILLVASYSFFYLTSYPGFLLSRPEIAYTSLSLITYAWVL